MSHATSQRRGQILTELFDKKHVTVRGLADRMDVSEATVRRDLKTLADQHDVQLVHGGATLPQHRDYSFRAKADRNPEAKRTIGRLAAEFVPDGDQIFVDSGTTCFQLVAALQGRDNVSVLTTSLRIATELTVPGLNMILLGGQYRAVRRDTVGPVAIHAIEHLRGYIAFIGTDGMSTDFGPAASDIDSAHLYQLIVENARETVLLADQSKFSAPSLFRIARWEQVSKVVTESEPDQAWKQFFKAQDIGLIYPSGEK